MVTDINNEKAMGFHKYSATRDLRQPHAHLDKKENGDIVGVLKMSFKKDAPKFEYCFMGENLNTLTYEACVIERHPKFKNIEQFENWCLRYKAEHDI